jgi:hypothetical protein
MKTAMQYGVQKPLAVLRTRGMSIPVRDEAGRLLTMLPKDLGAYLQQPGVMSKPVTTPSLNPAPARMPYGLIGSGLSALGPQRQN